VHWVELVLLLKHRPTDGCYGTVGKLLAHCRGNVTLCWQQLRVVIRHYTADV